MITVCFDLETYLIAQGAVFPRIVLGAISYPEPRVLVRDDILDAIETLLQRDDVRFVNHRIAFDFGCVINARPHLTGAVFRAYAEDRVECTKMLTQLADIGMYGSNKGGLTRLDAQQRRFPQDVPFGEHPERQVNLPLTYSLDKQAKRWLGVDLSKDETRTTYADFDGVPVEDLPDRQKEYVLSDLCALDLRNAVWDVPRDFALDNVYALSRRDFALSLNEARGRFTDGVAVERLQAEWSGRLDEARDALLSEGFVEQKRGGIPKTKIVTGFSVRRDVKARAMRRLGVSSAGELRKALRARMEGGTISPRHAGLCLAAMRKTQARLDTPAETREALVRLGLWREKTRVEKGERPLLDEYVLKQGPCLDYAEGLDRRIHTRLERTDKGQIQLTPENVELADGDETLGKIVLYKRANNITSYLERLAAPPPLHVRADGMAETGRTKSGGGIAGINDQNHRREYGFREVFIPRPGHVFVSVDYSQIELCALAQIQLWLFGKSALADAINAGKDCHVVFAAMLLGTSYEEAMRRKAAGDKELKEYRSLAKAFNFGRPGGLAEAKFVAWAKQAYGVTVPYSEWGLAPAEGLVRLAPDDVPNSVYLHALPDDVQERALKDEGTDARRPPVFVVDSDPADWRRVRTGWLRGLAQGGELYCREGTYAHLAAMHARAFPELPQYLAHCKQQIAEHGGKIVQFVSNRTRANCRFTSGANSYFQGLVADGATEALFRVWRECLTGESALRGSGCVWFVHDEIGLECPEDRMHEAAFRCSEIMVETMREYIPDVQVEAEPAAMRRWTKSADEPRVDAAERLMCEEDWRIAHGKLSEKEREDVLDFFRRFGLAVPTPTQALASSAEAFRRRYRRRKTRAR